LTTSVPALPDSCLRAIIDLPDDDGPRLCAADWWDERGAAERAEFVRVQCELAWLEREEACVRKAERYQCNPFKMAGKCLPCRRKMPLRRREWELYRGEWDALVIPAEWVTADESYPAFVYRRGFVEEVTCTAADFLAHADALTAACPLRRVRLTTWPGLSFGEVVYRNRSGETPGPGGYVRSATWNVLVEGKLRRFGLHVAVSGRECRSDGEAHLLAVFEAKISGARTVGGYFKARWPGIDFEMPTVGFRPGILSSSQLPLTTDGAPALADPRTLTRGVLP
jgi:uncharacterized protein (TIGR02996 family)